MARKKQKKNTFSDVITTLIVVIILAVALLYYYNNKEKEKDKFSGINQVFTDTATTANSDILQIHFIDVGQGDCIFIEFPDGKNMLIDAGDNGKEDIVIDYLNDLKVEEITLVLATHADADHIGGMQEVFEAFDVSYCLRPFVYYNGEDLDEFEESFNMPSGSTKKKNCSTKTYKNFLSALLDEKCGWEYFNKDSDFSQVFTYNGVESSYSIDFLTPTADIPEIGYSDANDYSPIFTLTYSDFCIMFTGDAEMVVEDELLKYYSTFPDVNVLKVGHHGSESSTSRELLKKIKPEEAVIMCGENNKYNHPRQITLDHLIEATAVIYRTDLQGDILLTVQSNGEYAFSTERKAAPSDLITGKEGIINND